MPDQSTSGNRIASPHHRPIFVLAPIVSTVDSYKMGLPRSIYLLTYSLDRSICLTNVQTHQVEWRFNTLGGWAQSIVSLPTSNHQVLVGCGDSMMRLLDVEGHDVRRHCEILWRGLATPVVSQAPFQGVSQSPLVAIGLNDGSTGILKVDKIDPLVYNVWHLVRPQPHKSKKINSICWAIFPINESVEASVLSTPVDCDERASSSSHLPADPVATSAGKGKDKKDPAGWQSMFQSFCERFFVLASNEDEITMTCVKQQSKPLPFRVEIPAAPNSEPGGDPCRWLPLKGLLLTPCKWIEGEEHRHVMVACRGSDLVELSRVRASYIIDPIKIYIVVVCTGTTCSPPQFKVKLIIETQIKGQPTAGGWSSWHPQRKAFAGDETSRMEMTPFIAMFAVGNHDGDVTVVRALVQANNSVIPTTVSVPQPSFERVALQAHRSSVNTVCIALAKQAHRTGGNDQTQPTSTTSAVSNVGGVTSTKSEEGAYLASAGGDGRVKVYWLWASSRLSDYQTGNTSSDGSIIFRFHFVSESTGLLTSAPGVGKVLANSPGAILSLCWYEHPVTHALKVAAGGVEQYIFLWDPFTSSGGVETSRSTTSRPTGKCKKPKEQGSLDILVDEESVTSLSPQAMSSSLTPITKVGGDNHRDKKKGQRNNETTQSSVPHNPTDGCGHGGAISPETTAASLPRSTVSPPLSPPLSFVDLMSRRNSTLPHPPQLHATPPQSTERAVTNKPNSLLSLDGEHECDGLSEKFSKNKSDCLRVMWALLQLDCQKLIRHQIGVVDTSKQAEGMARQGVHWKKRNADGLIDWFLCPISEPIKTKSPFFKMLNEDNEDWLMLADECVSTNVLGVEDKSEPSLIDCLQGNLRLICQFSRSRQLSELLLDAVMDRLCSKSSSLSSKMVRWNSSYEDQRRMLSLWRGDTRDALTLDDRLPWHRDPSSNKTDSGANEMRQAVEEAGPPPLLNSGARDFFWLAMAGGVSPAAWQAMVLDLTQRQNLGISVHQSAALLLGIGPQLSVQAASKYKSANLFQDACVLVSLRMPGTHLSVIGMYRSWAQRLGGVTGDDAAQTRLLAELAGRNPTALLEHMRDLQDMDVAPIPMRHKFSNFWNSNAGYHLVRSAIEEQKLNDAISLYSALIREDYRRKQPEELSKSVNISQLRLQEDVACLLNDSIGESEISNLGSRELSGLVAESKAKVDQGTSELAVELVKLADCVTTEFDFPGAAQQIVSSWRKHGEQDTPSTLALQSTQINVAEDMQRCLQIPNLVYSTWRVLHHFQRSDHSLHVENNRVNIVAWADVAAQRLFHLVKDCWTTPMTNLMPSVFESVEFVVKVDIAAMSLLKAKMQSLVTHPFSKPYELAQFFCCCILCFMHDIAAEAKEIRQTCVDQQRLSAVLQIETGSSVEEESADSGFLHDLLCLLRSEVVTNREPIEGCEILLCAIVELLELKWLNSCLQSEGMAPGRLREDLSQVIEHCCTHKIGSFN
eukprot:GHVN01034471.1.p1 GENE.GHVN01034471.1~~GHVN01034471.1.p1  ORF type:complete len:1480 (+),score=201.42 GHVN01034471.1:4127-8566(+)